ncbi:hypothetical protein AYO47_01655 [Planctomyces sp. SCGC AG-212-M04]|nr:hypothetical protein AYO47_01655 [Planctomyces sp. SCGC AG-212-M04]
MSRHPKPNQTHRFQGSVLTTHSQDHLGDVEGHLFHGYEKAEAWRGRFLWTSPARRVLQAGDSLVLRRDGCADAEIVIMQTTSQWGIDFRLTPVRSAGTPPEASNPNEQRALKYFGSGLTSRLPSPGRS